MEAGTPAPKGKAREAIGNGNAMKERLHPPGTGVPHRDSPPCVQSHSLRTLIPQTCQSLISGPKQRHHHICLNKEFRSDLLWWKVFARHWNGPSLIVHHQSKEYHLTSDASGSWGCGVWHGKKKWFQLSWDRVMVAYHIAAKRWSQSSWRKLCGGTCGKVVTHCDNSAVVSVINLKIQQRRTYHNAEVPIFH